MSARVAALSAEDILAIPEDQPERLFTGDTEEAKKEVRKLSLRWHPDRCPDALATAVFTHVQALYAAAEAKLSAGNWEIPGLLRVAALDGTAFEIRYSRKVVFDLGVMYVGKTVVAFDVPNVNADLVDVAERRIAGLTYADKRMQDEFARYFPTVLKRIDTATGSILVMRKTPDLLLLQDVLDHFKGKMPPRHAAWVISRLLNIACYLERQAKLSHNSLTLDTIFISPQYHSAAVLGGWWFATPLGDKMTAACMRMTQVAPLDVMQKKLGDSRTDMEMLKAVGRQLLGNLAGARLLQDPDVPKALSNWLTMSSNLGPVEAFREWQERVLIDAFGERKFVELQLSHEDLYSN